MFRNVYAYIYMHSIRINVNKETINLKKSRERYMGGFGVEEREGRNLNYNLKNKQINRRLY